MRRLIQIIRAWLFYRRNPELKDLTVLQQSMIIDDDPTELRHQVTFREDL